MTHRRIILSRGLGIFTGFGLVAGASVAFAQTGGDGARPPVVSNPVIQSTAPSHSRDLNLALARLAADPRNVSALFDAADAALRLGDSDAAIGFLTRANAVDPSNPRARVLMGKAYLVAENPVDAVRAFDDAERAGADVASFAADRGLAYDLVGDNGRAQRWYQIALSKGADDDLTRRYALSLAISGDRRGAEALLAPLIQQQDRATWRTRTFVMAVTGGPDEAVAIAYASMPQDLAAGIAPYLRYMPRLTPAQQAAAANFGRFPRAADIGRDDPRIVQYAALNPRSLRLAEAGLIPAGTPLGPKAAAEKPSREKRRRPGREERKLAEAAQARQPSATPSAPAPAAAPRTVAAQSAAAQSAAAPAPSRPTVLSALDVPPGTPRPPVPPIRPAAQPAATGTKGGATAAVASQPPAPVRAAPSPVSAPAATPVPPTAETQLALNTPRPAVAAAPPAAVASSPATSAPPTPSAAAPLAGGTLASAATFDLARAGTGAAVTTSAPAASPAASEPLPPQTPTASPAPIAAVPVPASSVASSAPGNLPAAGDEGPPDRPADLAALFSDFTPPPEETKTPVVAVDITRLPPKPPAPPPQADPRGERPDAPADVSRTSTKEAEKPTPVEAKKGKDSKSAKDAKDSKAKEAKEAKAKKAPPSHPSRIWVQVLVGANKDVMDREWRQMVKQAPDVLRGRKPYISPWRTNFRLLTGPFESGAAAQDFINRLGKSGVASYQWTSPAGQAVDSLPTK